MGFICKYKPRTVDNNIQTHNICELQHDYKEEFEFKYFSKLNASSLLHSYNDKVSSSATF